MLQWVMDEFDPKVIRPAFLDKARAESIGYIGADDVPTFDHEIAVEAPELPPDIDGEINPDELVPVGKGPSEGYKERWRAIARLHALGHTNNQIARKLGYSATGISLALQKDFVKQEVERFRLAYEADITSKVKEAALDGIERIHRIILDESEKSSIVLDASKWAVEKQTGKPRQEMNVESNTLSNFMELMKEMSRRGETIDAVDVTPKLPEPNAQAKGPEILDQEPTDAWNDWVNQNL